MGGDRDPVLKRGSEGRVAVADLVSAGGDSDLLFAYIYNVINLVY